MLKAAIYARYSSSLQRSTSVGDQIAVCRHAAARFACEVAADHVYADEELSGATARRPKYQQLMQHAKARGFDAIVVEAQDRLWRDQAEMHAALRRLRFWGDPDIRGRDGHRFDRPSRQHRCRRHGLAG